MANTHDTFPTYIIGVAIVIFFVLLVVYFEIIAPLMEDRARIKMEMYRSYDEEEYRYWKRELKRLYLRHIPLIGRFFDD